MSATGPKAAPRPPRRQSCGLTVITAPVRANGVTGLLPADRSRRGRAGRNQAAEGPRESSWRSWVVRCRATAVAAGCRLEATTPVPGALRGHTNVFSATLKCLCRLHHLLKTFCEWRDQQLPDGTVVWTSPSGQTYTTRPGSRILFPSLCRPTAAIAPTTVTTEPSRGLAMPRRKKTRAHNRQHAITAERRLNDEYVIERNKPPPF